MTFVLLYTQLDYLGVYLSVVECQNIYVYQVIILRVTFLSDGPTDKNDDNDDKNNEKGKNDEHNEHNTSSPFSLSHFVRLLFKDM